MLSTGTRTCTICSQGKALEEFRWSGRTRFGVVCRDCRVAVAHRRARFQDAEVFRAAGMRYCTSCREPKRIAAFPRHAGSPDGRASVCLECATRKSRARWEADKDAFRTRAREAYERDRKERPDVIRARGRAAASARRARLRGVFVEQVDPRVVWERDEGVCGICGNAILEAAFDVDHIVPLAHGGEHSYRNVRAAHVTCNRRRGRAVASAK